MLTRWFAMVAVFLLAAWPVPSQNRPVGQDLFSPDARLLTEGRIFSIASDDLDGDGRPDIVVSDFLNHARILFNDARHAFTKVVPLTSSAETATSGHGVGVADFNGDRRLDLFLVYNGNPSRLLFGDGKGGFQDSGRPIGTQGLHGTSVKVVDIDGDGDMDAFITYYQQSNRLYLNDGTGVLTASDQPLDGSVVLGDVDRDGDADIITLPEGGDQAVVRLNTRGRFVPQERLIAVGSGLARMELADLDGDRDLDLVAVGRTAKTTLWENDGRGSFRRWEQTLEPGPRMAAGDIDLDGDVDLVVGTVVWINAGPGRFERVQTLDLGTLPTAVLLVDIDQDGDLDLLANRGNRETARTQLLWFANTLRRR